MSDPPPHLYRQQALARGRDAQTIARTLEVREAAGRSGAYPVYTLAHLAQLTGASWAYLRDVAARRRDPYFDIDRPKRDGRTRPLSSPEPVLMDVQRWLLHRVLSACQVHAASYAYQRQRSIVDCARQHLGARWLIKLDVHDFFETINERRVFGIFRGLGYTPLLSFEMTRLCTRIPRDVAVHRNYYRSTGKAPYDVDAEGRLPQGAPTSGTLANAVARGLDVKLSHLAARRGLVYTRYSDDIVLSTAGAFSRSEAVDLVRQATAVLASEGLAAHRAKTRIVPPGARHIVLGLLIDHDRVRLLPEFKRRIEVHIRGVERFGIIAHAEHRRFASVLSMINHVDGCIAFAESVDDAFAHAMREKWQTALHAQGFPQGI